jgi:hypothetical protein
MRRCLVYLRRLPHGVRFDSPLLVSLLLPCLLPACLLSGLLFGPVAAEETVEWKGERVLKDGVVHVMNPAEPMEPPLVYELRELWRLESETEDGEVVFGAIEAIERDDDGNSYFLDFQLKTVHQVSPNGSYVRSIGREGEGPGEFQWPMDLFVASDSTIGIVDAQTRKIAFLDCSGRLHGEWRPRGFEGIWLSVLRAHQVPEGIILSCEYSARRDEAVVYGCFVGLFDQMGDLLRKMVERSSSRELGDPVIHNEEQREAFVVMSTDTDGTAYVSPRFSEYSIHVFDPDGSPRRVITRECDPVPRSEEEIAEMRVTLRAYHDRSSRVEVQVMGFHRNILWVYPRGGGSLWVETSRGWTDRPRGVMTMLDQFDRDGRFVGQVILRGPQIDPWENYTFIFSDRLFVVTSGFESLRAALGASSVAEGASFEGESAVPAVICYELAGVDPD